MKGFCQILRSAAPAVSRSLVVGLIALLLATLLTAQAWAGPKETFDDLFAQEIVRVEDTTTKADDVALARVMVEVAKQSKEYLGLVDLTCAKAHRLSATAALSDPVAQQVAIEALFMRAFLIPEARPQSLAALVPILERQYLRSGEDKKKQHGVALINTLSQLAAIEAKAGKSASALEHYHRALAVATAIDSEHKDELIRRVSSAQTKDDIIQRVARAAAKLKANPRDRLALNDALRLTIVELNSPQRAMAFVRYADERTGLLIQYAADERNPPRDAVLALGDWYRDWATKTKMDHSKAAMLRRSLGFYQRFLKTHKQKDTDGRRAALIVERLQKELKALSGSSSTAPDPSGNTENKKPSKLVRWPMLQGDAVFFWPNLRATDPVVRSTSELGASIDEQQWYRLTGGALYSVPSPGENLGSIKKRSEFTIEAVLQPANLKQDGPARILTYSDGAQSRNFTLGQSGNTLDFRLLTSVKSYTDLKLGKLRTDRAQHVLVTLNNGELVCEIDGEETARIKIEGNLSTWLPDQKLVIGNEHNASRPWRGRIKLIAIYSRGVNKKLFPAMRARAMGFDVAAMKAANRKKR